MLNSGLRRGDDILPFPQGQYYDSANSQTAQITDGLRVRLRHHLLPPLPNMSDWHAQLTHSQ
jgi:hypothetical protein